MNRGMYVLDDDGNPVREPDLLKWGAWMEAGNRRLDRTEIAGTTISTVFLGLDHGWGGRPLLYETMVFGEVLDQEQERYSSREEAIAGHAKMVQRVRSLLS